VVSGLGDLQIGRVTFRLDQARSSCTWDGIGHWNGRRGEAVVDDVIGREGEDTIINRRVTTLHLTDLSSISAHFFSFLPLPFFSFICGRTRVITVLKLPSRQLPALDNSRREQYSMTSFPLCFHRGDVSLVAGYNARRQQEHGAAVLVLLLSRRGAPYGF